MLDRFTTDNGSAALDALREQRIVMGSEEIAAELLASGELIAVRAGVALISEGAIDRDVYFILSGAFEVLVGGKSVATRQEGTEVGEISFLDPSQPRSADVIA